MGDAAAGNGAAETSLVGQEITVPPGGHFLHRLGVDLTNALELDLVEVAGRQRAERLHGVDHGVGAELGQLLAAVVLGEQRMGLAHHRHESLGIVDRNPDGAVDRDRLEVFGTHDRAHAGAPGGAVQVVDDAGEAHAALAGDADRGDLEQGVLVLGLDPFLGFPDRLAPELAGRDDLDLLVDDVQVDRLGGDPLDDEQVVAGELELGAELAAGVGAGDGAGQRPLGDHRVASAGRGHGPGQRPGREDQHVVRPHGVGLGVHVLPEVLGGQAALAQVGRGPVHVQRLGFAAALGQVDPQDLLLPSHGASLPARRWPRRGSSRPRPPYAHIRSSRRRRR